MGIEENQIDLLSCLKVGDKSIVKASERVACLNDFFNTTRNHNIGPDKYEALRLL